MNLNEVNAYIYQHIPITTALGLKVEDYDGQRIIVSTPLAPNLNHRDTAFGGSLSATAILSGWALLFIKFKELQLEARLVIQQSQFDFTAPVDSDFEAVCSLPDAQNWQRFLNTLQRRGRARVKLRSEIYFADGQPGGSHEGVYVAVKQEAAPQS